MMRKARQVQVRTYRDHRFEIIDDGDSGWAVIIYSPASVRQHTLRDHMANGLKVLMEEAETMVNRHVDANARGLRGADEDASVSV